MPWAVAAAVVGAGASIYASGEASDAQSEAAASAQALEQKRYEQGRTDLAPYRDAGSKALGYYQDFLGANGAEAAAGAHDMFRSSPGYTFALDEGIRATEGSAAARGGLLSGGAIKAVQDRGMGLADQTSGSYLDRFLGLANMGQASAAGTANLGAASGAREANYITDAGAAQAGGYLSAAQGVNGAISNGLQLYGYGKGNGWWDTPAASPQSFSRSTTASYFPKVG